MKIKWLGHSSFALTSRSGVSVITDPFGEIGYPYPSVSASLVTLSHDHFDHNNIKAVSGHPLVIKRVGDFEQDGVRLQGIPSYHDEVMGAKRGENIVFLIEIDGVKICHMGDLGEPLSAELLAKIGAVDVLLVPVGGTYTIDAGQALEYVKAISPKLVIPMHYKTADCTVDVAPVTDFTSLLDGIPLTNFITDVLPISREALDGMQGTQVIVLEKSKSFRR